MPQTEPDILVDGREMQLLHLPGKSDFSLVTFHAMNAVADGRSGFGLRLARSRDIDIYLIVPTRPNWYPAAEAHKCADIVAKRLDRPSVAYGASMGGYGALKYGRALGASATLAFSPQITIDPEVTGTQDRRYERFFEADLHGDMAVTANDLSPKPHIICDPEFQHDVFQRSLLKADFAAIDLPCLGHRPAVAMTPSANAVANLRDALDGRTDALTQRMLSSGGDTLQFALGAADKALKEQRCDEAIALIEAAQANFDRFDKTIGARVLRARIYGEAGRPDIGIAELKSLLAEYPTQTVVRRLHSELLWKAGEYDAAITELSESVEQSGNAVLAVRLSKMLRSHRPQQLPAFVKKARARWPERATQFTLP